ncbi:MAG TPA: hypothetical protein HA232_03085 [Methanocellales archaeon]|nr:hypothetical protein [Methanocellales archaeon]
MSELLTVSKITLDLHFTTPAKLPYWMGSAFRGGFGQNLRRACCTNLNKDCQVCDTKENCLFYYTHMKMKAERGYAPPQKPIILIPPFFGKEMCFEKDGHLDAELLFFGDFRKYLPHAFLGMSLLGQTGIGSVRCDGRNRFEIASATCNFSGQNVYDGKTINLTNLMSMDVSDVAGYDGNYAKIGFKTPFTGRTFPLEFSDLLYLVRNRLIRFVNEYGNKEKIPEFIAKGNIKNCSKHYHELPRRSMRSDKTLFKGYTGVIEYDIKEMDDVGRWLLNLGLIIGCGPDSSFGCGFLQNID